MTDPAAIAAAAELREKIRKAVERDPNITAVALGVRFDIHKTTVYGHLRALRDEGEIIDAVVEEDTVPKEKRMATKKQNGGGASSDDEKLLDWYEAREKELLERLADLTARFLKSLDRIEELEAAAPGEG